MGQKINPKGFRVGTVFNWDSRWFVARGRYKDFVLEDKILRDMVTKKLAKAGLVKVEIERSINKLRLIIHVVRPGMVIGRGGQGLEALKSEISALILKNRKSEKTSDKTGAFKIDLKVEQVKEPFLSAVFVANQISDQLARRIPHKRAVRFALDKVMAAQAKGVKVILSGRIAGAEIGRRETYKLGSVPLSTIREEVDYASSPALTKSGYIGVKVWICRQ